MTTYQVTKGAPQVLLKMAYNTEDIQGMVDAKVRKMLDELPRGECERVRVDSILKALGVTSEQVHPPPEIRHTGIYVMYKRNGSARPL